MHGRVGVSSPPRVAPFQLHTVGRGVQVQEHVGRRAPADATALVRDLDGDVVRALHDVDINFWYCLRILMELHRGPHAVLEHLEEHVVEMAGDVDEVDSVCVVHHVADLDVELGMVHVLIVAEERGALVGLLRHLGRVTGGVDGPEKPGVLPTLLWTVHGLVGGDQHVNGDPVHVEPVQEILDGLVQPVLGVDNKLARLLQSVESICHLGNNVL